MRKLESWFRVGKQRMLQSHETLRHCNSSKAFISGPPYVAQALLAAVSVGALHQLGPPEWQRPPLRQLDPPDPTLCSTHTSMCATPPLARQTHFGRSLTRRRVGGNARDCFSAGVAKPWPGQMPYQLLHSPRASLTLPCTIDSGFSTAISVSSRALSPSRGREVARG
jgi:hypothetical protein